MHNEGTRGLDTCGGLAKDALGGALKARGGYRRDRVHVEVDNTHHHGKVVEVLHGGRRRWSRAEEQEEKKTQKNTSVFEYT